MQLHEESGEVLDADATCWSYSPGGVPAAEVDIAKEIKKPIEEME